MSSRDLFVEFSLGDGDERPGTWSGITQDDLPSKGESSAHSFSYYFNYSPFAGVGHGEFTARLIWNGVSDSSRHMPCGVQGFGVDVETGRLVGSPTPVVHFRVSNTIDIDEFVRSWEVTCSPSADCFYEDWSGRKRILAIAEVAERQLSSPSDSARRTSDLFHGERSAGEGFTLEESLLCAIDGLTSDSAGGQDDYDDQANQSPLPSDWDRDINYHELINALIQAYGSLGYRSWPFRIQKVFADHPSIEARVAAVRLFTAAEPSQEALSLLSRLACDAESAVRCAAASNRDITPSLLDQFANDDDPVVRAAAARNSSASRDLLERLSRDACDDVRLAVVKNISLPDDLFCSFASDGSETIRAIVAQSHKADSALLSAFSADNSKVIRAAAAKNCTISASLREQLANDSCEEVRAAVGENATPDLFLRLAQDVSARVCAAIASNQDLPHELLLRLSEDPVSDVRQNVARNNEASEPILARLALDDSAEVRGAVAASWGISTDTLVRLAVDSSVEVREIAASNDNESHGEAFEILCMDPAESVRVCLAENTEIPGTIMMKLAKDPSDRVRSAIAGNESLYNPPEALETLSIDPSVDVRRAVAANGERTPVEALIRLAENADEDIVVRFNAAHSLGFYGYC